MKSKYIIITMLVCLAGFIMAMKEYGNRYNNRQKNINQTGINFPADFFQKSRELPVNQPGEQPDGIVHEVMEHAEIPAGNFLPLGDSAFDVMSIPDPQLRALLSGNMSPNQKEEAENQENTFTKPEPVSSPIALYTGEERTFGYSPQKPTHNPADEFFYLEVKQPLTSQTEVYLEYDLYGVEDNTQVSRSINDQPVFGGYVVKQHNGWSKQSELLNPDLLKQGINTIRFSIDEDAKYSYTIKNLKLRIADKETSDNKPTKAIVVKGKKNNEIQLSDGELNETENDRKLIVNQPTTAYYYRRFGFVQGFVTGQDYDKAQIRIGNQKVRTYKGEFESMISRNSQGQEAETNETVLPSHAPWNTTIEAVFPDGEILSVDVTFEQPAQWDHLSGFDANIHFTEEEITQNESFELVLGTAVLQGIAGSLQENATLSITALRAIDLPKLNPGMVNVTADYDGYRFLPHGSNFDKPLNITIGYDSAKLPKGHYPQEIRTYYYDESRSHWVALPRDSVNKGKYLVCSRTTHFTDMINAIVKAPEMPETQEYTPTSLKELQAADPSSGIQMLQPPTANSQGTASLSYPINVPAGRQGMQPNLAVNYSSEAANGLLGMGWDMQIPAITVDTKWGSPRYHPTDETESYSLNGEELLPSPRHRTSWEGRNTSGTKTFYPRVEGNFEKIERYNNKPYNYFWIVTDKQGTKYYYGTYDGRNADTNALMKTKDKYIGHWPLCKVVDINGNYMEYSYEIRNQSTTTYYMRGNRRMVNEGIELGQQLWLNAITYTGYESPMEKGAYKVVFCSEDYDVDVALAKYNSLENSTRSSVAPKKTFTDSLSSTKESTPVKARGLGDIIWNDVPGSSSPNGDEEDDETIPPCGNPDIRIQVCLVSPCKQVDLSGSNFYLGRNKPKFKEYEKIPNSPYPVTFKYSDNPAYVQAKPDASNGIGNGCVEFMVCPNTTYYLVVNPPSFCNADPISLSFKVDHGGHATIIHENGIPTIGENVNFTRNADGTMQFEIPVECDCSLPTDEVYCPDCWEHCDPPCYIRRKKIYIGVQDNYCVMDKLPLCTFELFCEPNPSKIYRYSTGYTKIQPINARKEEIYHVKGTYFGANYQSTPIEFSFKIHPDDHVEIIHQSGILSHSHPNIIVMTYNGGNVIEILMPVIPKSKQVKLRIIDGNGHGVPNNTFLLGNTNNGIIQSVFTTDQQGYTPVITLQHGNIYYIGEVDITAYSQGIVGHGPYSNYVANWDNMVELYLSTEKCNLRIGKEDHFPTPNSMSCSSDVCTFVYIGTVRVNSNDIRIKKKAPDGELIAGTRFRLTNRNTNISTTHATGNNGYTSPIEVTGGQRYRLQEISTPSGYQLDTNSIYINVAIDGTISVESQMYNDLYNYNYSTRTITVTNQRKSLNFRIKKQDASNPNIAIEGAGIRYYDTTNYNVELGSPYTGVDGLTYLMKMDYGKTYYIEEFAQPQGYSPFYPCFALIKVDANGNIQILDSAQMYNLLYQDNTGAWIITLVNHKSDTTPRPTTHYKDTCDPYYTYDFTINTRLGFKQSSKEKLSKIVVFYENECVRTYTFCYGTDVFGRAQLHEINQWNSTDTGEAFSHKLEYYNDIGTARDLFTNRVKFKGTEDIYSDEQAGSKINRKLRNFFLGDIIEPSILGGSQTWSFGLNGGADVGLFPNFIMKTLSGGLYFNGNYTTSKGRTTMVDINGDGLPDRVYNIIKGTENQIYYCLQIPDSNKFGTYKRLYNIKRFLQDEGDNTSAGLQGSAILHGGIQKGGGFSQTNIFFADVNGDGLLELVHDKGIKRIGDHQRPPSFSFDDCLPPEITVVEDSVIVICDTNYNFEGSYYERDRSNEIRYDVVRVWQAALDSDNSSDLTYSLCAPVHLAYDSIAMENFCGNPDSVIVSIEYYGSGLTGQQEHRLLWSKVIGNNDENIYGISHCDGLPEEPEEPGNPDPDPDPCPVVIRKINQNGASLSGVVFRLADGTTLTTSTSGYTPSFDVPAGGSIRLNEISSPGCTLITGTIIVNAADNCNITARLESSSQYYAVTNGTVNGKTVKIITITNQCNYTPDPDPDPDQCRAIIRKIDQEGRLLQGVVFQSDEGLSLRTDSYGNTPSFDMKEIHQMTIHEISPLSCCDPLPVPIEIYSDANCNFDVHNAKLGEPEWINGVLTQIIIVENHCHCNPNCPAQTIIRKVNQEGKVLRDVVFQMEDGTELITDDNGNTPPFFLNVGESAVIHEMPHLDCCNPLHMPIHIHRESDCYLHIDIHDVYYYHWEWIEEILTNVITIENQCHCDNHHSETPCQTIIHKVTKDEEKPLEGVVFQLNNGTTLTSGPDGYTSPFGLQPGECLRITEVASLSHCNPSGQGLVICGKDNCEISVDPSGYNVYKDRINGMEVNVVMITNECDESVMYKSGASAGMLTKTASVMQTQSQQSSMLNVDFSALTLKKGDMLFFRVRPYDNGVKKKVVWDPAVIPHSTALNLPGYRDENGRNFGGGNKASQSQLLQGDSLFYCPLKGNIKIESVIPAFSGLTDAVSFEIWKENNRIYHYSVAAGAGSPLRDTTLSLAVDSTTKLKFKVLCSSNINMHKIKWFPKVYYDNIILAGNTIQALVLDDSNNYVRMLEYYIAPFHDFYHKTVKLDANRLFPAHNIPATGATVHQWEIGTTRAVSGNAYFTIKQEGQLLFAKNVSFSTSSAGSSTGSISPSVPLSVDPNKPIYLSCYISNPAVAEKVGDCYLKINNILYRCVVYTRSPHYAVYGSMYGGWGQFLYMTDTMKPVDREGLMKFNLITQMNNINSEATANAFVDTFSMGGSVEDVMSYSNTQYDAKMNQLRTTLACLPMFTDPENKGHVGYYPNAYIRGADMNIGGYPCYILSEEDEEEPCDNITSITGGSGGTSGGGTGGSGNSGSGSSNTSLSGTDMLKYGFAKTSSSDNKSYSYGTSLPGLSWGDNVSTSTTTQENDLMDLNGDGFPDMIRGSYVYYSLPCGGAWENAKVVFTGTNTQNHHKSTAKSTSRSFTADPMGFIRFADKANKGKWVITEADNEDETCGISVTGSNSRTTATDNTDYTLLDINGDGLPDRVFRTAKTKNGKSGNIALNLGYDFGDYETWTSLDTVGIYTSDAESNSLGAGGFSAGSASLSGGLGGTTSYNQTKVTYADLNGDGLPDKIVVKNNNTLRVYFNVGCGYNASFEEITTHDFALYDWNKSQTKNGSIGVTGGIPIAIVWAKVSVSGGGDASFTMSATNLQITDMDGDGVNDIVFATEDGLWVKYSRLGRTGKLKQINNPMGGSIELGYAMTDANVFHSRRWVMDTVIIRDNFTGDGADKMMTTYEYDKGYYDRNERAFYGFAIVNEKHRDTERNNAIYRRYNRYYYNNNFYQKGLLLTEEITNGRGDSLYIVTMNKYSSRILTQRNNATYVTLDTTIVCYYEGTKRADIRQQKTFQYDDAGRVVYQTSWSTTMPIVAITSKYTHPQPTNYNISIPKEVIVHPVGNTQNFYRKRTTSINTTTGQLTSISDYYSTSGILTTSMSYDGYGNVARMSFPGNSSFTYQYENDVHTYPVKITDAFGHFSQSSNYDYRFGIPRTVIDKSGYAMYYTLDNFGRIIEIVAPKEQQDFSSITLDTDFINLSDTNLATGKRFNMNDFPLGGLQLSSREIIPVTQKYTVKYVYKRGNVEDNIPFSAITYNYDPANAGNNIRTFTFSDGLGRIIQTKKDAEVNGKKELVVSGKAEYDAFGRTVKTYYPTIEEKTLVQVTPANAMATPILIQGNILIPVIKPHGNLVMDLQTADNIAPSITTYDILDRPRTQKAPDNTQVTYKYGFDIDNGNGTINRTCTLFRTSVTDQRGNTSVSLSNVDKQPFKVQSAVNQSVWFAYNDVGDLLKVRGTDFERTYAYDKLGRRTKYEEGALKDTLTYEGINLKTKTSYWKEQGQQKHKTIRYTYDKNRLKSVRSTEYKDSVEYTYNNKGKLTSIKDASGTQQFEYGNMGEVTKQTRIYTLPFMQRTIKLETKFEYDSWGRTISMTYPDGEKVTYGYDYGGMLKKVSGTKGSQSYKYVDSIKYDKFGAKVLTGYSNRMITTYSYNSQTLRLYEQNIVKKPQTGAQQNYLKVLYTYDRKGNIESINTTNYKISSFTANETFVYDAADQLTSASGKNGSLYTAQMTYGNYGRVNTYNTRFTDPQPNGNGTQQTNTSYTYNTTNAPSNNFAPVSASNGITFEHGINGSMNKRTTPQKTEYYLYNAFDQMKAYSNNGETYGYYGYDDAGQRTYKYTLAKTSSRTNNVGSNILEVEKLMLYPNGYINIDQKGNYTKHYYADDARIASKIGNGYSTSISSTNITDTMPRFHMKKELGDVTNDIIDNIVYPHGQINNLTGAGVNIQENGLYFYHGNHLSSTQMVTDVNGNVSQAILYNPWGSIISEYKADWKLDTIPRYFFNSKEKDDESGLYYYEARYYSDQDIVFRARDPAFEEYPATSPYAYCNNNPVKYIDPDGRKFVVPRAKIAGQKGRYNVTFDGTTATMQQAGRKSSGETMQYKSGANTFVDNMIASYNYIVNNGADVDNAMQQMAASTDIEIQVINTRNDASYSNGKIRMDFSRGTKVDREDGVSGYESPALGFWSEVYHGYLDNIATDVKNGLSGNKYDQYNAQEEHYVHVTKGNQVIDALQNKNPSNGETKRNKYEDGWRGSSFNKPVKMNNVIDTEPR